MLKMTMKTYIYLLCIALTLADARKTRGDKTVVLDDKLHDLFPRSDNVAWVPDPAGSGERVLRIFYRKGSYAGNRNDKGGYNYMVTNAFQPGNSVTLTYDIYFSPNFGFARGGKLPGLFGGTGTCSGGTGTPTCFSTRFMWRREGAGEIYGYIPNEKGNWFCSHPDVHCNFQYGHSFGRGSFRFAVGRWQNFGQRITLNTPGRANGSMEIFYRGQSVYRISGITFRNDRSIMIDKMYFSTFFGGSSDTSWAAPSDCYTYYKNWKITRHN